MKTVEPRRNGVKASSSGVDAAGQGVAQQTSVDSNTRVRHFDHVAWKGGEDLEYRSGISRARAGREVGASAAKSGDGRRQARRDETIADQRQAHWSVETHREGGG